MGERRLAGRRSTDVSAQYGEPWWRVLRVALERRRFETVVGLEAALREALVKSALETPSWRRTA